MAGQQGITVRALDADDWRDWRALRLAALAEAPYAFSSRLADWQREGDTEQRWRDRLNSVPFNVIAELDDVPAGMASGADDGRSAELISMWVAPFARGRGVADALVQAVVGWAGATRPGTLRLRVMVDNERAAAVYRRHGFFPGDVVPGALPGEPVERWMTRAPQG